MKHPKNEWMKWLTAEEAVYLFYLKTVKQYKFRYRVAMDIQYMRSRACKRKERNARQFAIYIEAMEDWS